MQELLFLNLVNSIYIYQNWIKYFLHEYHTINIQAFLKIYQVFYIDSPTVCIYWICFFKLKKNNKLPCPSKAPTKWLETGTIVYLQHQKQHRTIISICYSYSLFSAKWKFANFQVEKIRNLAQIFANLTNQLLTALASARVNFFELSKL